MGIANDAGINETDNVKELVVVYEAFFKCWKGGQKLKDEGRFKEFDSFRFHKLESKVNGLFAELSNSEQRTAVDILVAKNCMDPLTADLLTVVDGRVTKC